MVTKLKSKLSSLNKLILLLIAGVLLCSGLLYFIDVFLNGFFLDWFDGQFMITRETVTSTGEAILIHEPLWIQVKMLILVIACGSVAFVTVLVWGISRLYARSQVRKSISFTAQCIEHYMNQELPSSQVFPKSYAEVSFRIVEIKSAMQRQEQLQKEEVQRKNDLITYLAHDLKTPLTSIIGYLSLLKEAPDMPPEQKAKYVSITFDKACRLETLINEFFEITRYNLQEIILEKEWVDLTFMLVQMADEFYPILSAHGNTITLSVPDNLSAEVDPVRLARVFNNILKNAVAYSYEGTPIELSAWETPTEICISIRNQGKTIPAHKLETIFEKFFRLDDARVSNTGGAGLGLAIAKEIVTLHGGTISAESKNGLTTFLVVLPRSDSKNPNAAPPLDIPDVHDG
ncbi:MAG TPA: HAMP domain-containing histidine kinase [Candidatus Limivivens merdigallinarum]|uniref:histidine kinase n=1 Tax=Candidatus Limivivens merdigallinarum TaxID=2840859 RepID=A0A9D1CZL9_9FIRM|nr:HAMP domain-containing histidine kinase [Candidatus Limivivens merdigallinarum]